MQQQGDSFKVNVRVDCSRMALHCSQQKLQFIQFPRQALCDLNFSLISYLSDLTFCSSRLPPQQRATMTPLVFLEHLRLTLASGPLPSGHCLCLECSAVSHLLGHFFQLLKSFLKSHLDGACLDHLFQYCKLRTPLPQDFKSPYFALFLPWFHTVCNFLKHHTIIYYICYLLVASSC